MMVWPRASLVGGRDGYEQMDRIPLRIDSGFKFINFADFANIS
jgi:hypothetical protein